MLLVIDIGNSCIKNVLFDGEKIIKLNSFDSLKNDSKKSLRNKYLQSFDKYEITSCAIISVVKGADEIIKSICDELYSIKSIILKPEHSKIVKIKSNCLHQVGMDRIANVYGIINLPLPAIVVDIGTAITFDILSADKEFLGGAIMPGVNMGLKALAQGTSKLPEIAAQESPVAIGNTTETCILSGVIRGTAYAIDGLLEQSIKELGGCKTIVLTGGQSELVSKYMKTKVKINRNLTSIGLKNMYDIVKK